MEVEFRSSDLDRLETDPSFKAGLAEAIVRAFRKRMQFIRAAVNERDLYAIPSYRFKKLGGSRMHQRSFRLNDQYRLVVELHTSGLQTKVVIIGIEK